MTELDAGAETLAAALAEEEELYSSLLALAVREEQAIVGGDVAALTSLTSEKEQLLELLAALETERMTALTAIASAAGMSVDSLTLSGVSALVAPEQSAALTEVGVQLRVRAVALKQANDRNADLLRGSREIVDRWITYLRHIVSGTLTYTAEGSPHQPGSNRVIDRSA